MAAMPVIFLSISILTKHPPAKTQEDVSINDSQISCYLPASFL